MPTQAQARPVVDDTRVATTREGNALGFDAGAPDGTGGVARRAGRRRTTRGRAGPPVFVYLRWGIDAIATKVAVVEWDVAPPKDRNSEATALVSASNAIKGLTEALAVHGKQPDIDALCVQYGIRIKDVQRTIAAANGDPASARLARIAEAA